MRQRIIDQITASTGKEESLKIISLLLKEENCNISKYNFQESFMLPCALLFGVVATRRE
jgi:hypothetical protein